MKKSSFAILSGAILLLSAFSVIHAVDWQLSDNYAIRFSGEEVEGVFEQMKGEISFDANDLHASKFAFTVDVNSIKTGNGTKTRHAKSDKWLDAAKYPVITFTSKAFSKTAQGYVVDGTLDMHGTQKQVSIPFTFKDHTFHSQFSVNRADYGVGSLKGLSKQVSNEIRIEVDIPVTQKQ